MILPLAILFPFPKPPTYKATSQDLYLVERRATRKTRKACLQLSSTSDNLSVPVFFLNKDRDFNKLIIYFHGNSEDAGYKPMRYVNLGAELDSHVLVVEYPQYGVYKHAKLSEKRIKADADTVYRFCVQRLGYAAENVSVYGRSIGTGPAIYLAARHKLRLLVLIAPYLSLRKVALEMTVAAYLMHDIFNSEKLLASVSCPTFILHGKNDDIVPFAHGQQIYDTLKERVDAVLVAPEQIGHNDFRFYTDLVDPLREFEDKIDKARKSKEVLTKSKPKLENLKRLPLPKQQLVGEC